MVTQEASELTASRGHIKCTVTHGAIPSERDPGLAEQLLRTERIRKKLPLHWYEKNKGNTKQPEKMNKMAIVSPYLKLPTFDVK